MADKTTFTPEEWSKILSGPMLAGMAVTLAEPGGIWGTLKEGMASARTMVEAKHDGGANALMKAVVVDIETSDGRKNAQQAIKAQLTGKSAGELKQQVIASLSQVGDLLDQKGGQDAPGFKVWLKHVSENVAEASTEGGFLGFGGVKVSEAETASINDVTRALRMQ
jgi:hypothetical protein